MWAEIARLLRRLPWWRMLPRRRRWAPPPPVIYLPHVLPEEPEPKPLGIDDEGREWVDFGPAEPEPEESNVVPLPEPEVQPIKRTMPWAGGTRGKYDTLTSKARDAIDETASLILDRFDNLNIRGTNRDHSRVSLMLIDGLLNNDFYLADAELRNIMQGGGKYSPGTFDYKQDHAELAEMAWPLNHSVVNYYDDDDLVALFQATSTTPEAVRGRVKLTASKMVEVKIGQFGINGMWSVQESVAGLIGKRWVDLGLGMEKRWDNINVAPMSWRNRGSKDKADFVHDTISLMITQALETRYQWHVAFGGRKHGLRIVLPTNPTGALKLFKDRELTAGKSRREALRHWVENFIRDDDVHGSVYVRDHLRGNTEFTWNGMETELMVSAFDLEKNEAFKSEAQYWRANRKHNSVRVRLKRGKK
jgi:hypothetical protein